MSRSPRRLIGFARLVLSRMVRIEKIIKDQTGAISEAVKASHADKSTPPKIIAEAYLPQAVEIKKNADDAADDKKYQRWSLLIAWLTLAAVVIYAGVAILQWREMIGATNAASDAVHESRLNRQQSIQALNASIEQFRLDQRAWVNPSSKGLAKESNNSMDWPFSVLNSGKTPAFKESAEMFGLMVANDESVSFDYSLPNIGKDRLNTVIPNAQNEILGVPVYFNNNKSELVYFTPAVIEQIKAGKVVFILYARITYNDVFSVPHWVNFCTYSFGAPVGYVGKPPIAANQCAAYNKTDDTKAN
jgi:hypothetical protein